MVQNARSTLKDKANNQEENQIARDAARNVGIHGSDSRGPAIRQFMRDFHNLPRYQRIDMGYFGIQAYAQQWWAENRSRFENNNQRYRY